VFKLLAKGFNTGFFDMVELNIAKSPTTDRIMKNLSSSVLVDIGNTIKIIGGILKKLKNCKDSSVNNLF